MLEGSCHCGKVKWTYALTLESVTACNCTLCRRYGALWAYARDRKLNGFHFCTECGCLAYYLSNHTDEQGRLRAAVNLRMLKDPSQIQNLPIDHFDGLDKFEDLPRNHRTVADLWY